MGDVVTVEFTSGLLWRGRPVEELTRDELIEALVTLSRRELEARKLIEALEAACAAGRAGAHG